MLLEFIERYIEKTEKRTIYFTDGAFLYVEVNL